MKKGQQLILTLLGCAAVIGIISVGTNIPSTSGELDLCNLKTGQRGTARGIVTSVDKYRGRASIKITEGTEGCSVRVLASWFDVVELGTAGNRVKFSASVIDETTLQLKDKNSQEFDPTVVDQDGKTEELSTVKLTVWQRPQLQKSNVGIITFSVPGEQWKQRSLKLSKAKVEELPIKVPVQIKYSPTTFEVFSIEQINDPTTNWNPGR